MPKVSKTDPIPERPVVIVVFGEPGIGKTTLFNTSKNPYLLDFDRGFDRAAHRQDTLAVSSWEEVEAEEKTGDFKNYNTIGIDTAKAALDDFLMVHVIKKNPKLKSNKLKAFGEIGEEFKLFVSNRRSEQADLVILAHSKIEEDGDVKKRIPDVTGQSYALLLRIADQVGYMKAENGNRIISWDQTDIACGKNVAQLPVTIVPAKEDPAFPTFMAEIITSVRKSIASMSEQQKAAEQKMGECAALIENCETTDLMNSILENIKTMPVSYKSSLQKQAASRCKEMGWTQDKDTKKIIATEQTQG